MRHLGRFPADRLSLREVDGYRDARLKETTQRGGPPSPATLDREVELLKRMLSYAGQKPCLHGLAALDDLIAQYTAALSALLSEAKSSA